jgi:hypothetical protein
MFRRRQPPHDRLVVDGAQDNENMLLPVLTPAEVLETVHLLEEYIGLSADEKTTELTGTLIVRLLDRLQGVATGCADQIPAVNPDPRLRHPNGHRDGDLHHADGSSRHDAAIGTAERGVVASSVNRAR